MDLDQSMPFTHLWVEAWRLKGENERLEAKIIRLGKYFAKVKAMTLKISGGIDAVCDDNKKLREALEFYADPETYFGVAFLCDPPCGDFTTDESETGTELGVKPGKRAREALKGGE